ncbi:MAG: hypothetical protein EXR75_13765 [Myxococcales bacterium]|nr:hypothetical protein [Myxococcales bacterium]
MLGPPRARTRRDRRRRARRRRERRRRLRKARQVIAGPGRARRHNSARAWLVRRRAPGSGAPNAGSAQRATRQNTEREATHDRTERNHPRRHRGDGRSFGKLRQCNLRESRLRECRLCECRLRECRLRECRCCHCRRCCHCCHRRGRDADASAQPQHAPACTHCRLRPRRGAAQQVRHRARCPRADLLASRTRVPHRRGTAPAAGCRDALLHAATGRQRLGGERAGQRRACRARRDRELRRAYLWCLRLSRARRRARKLSRRVARVAIGRLTRVPEGRACRQAPPPAFDTRHHDPRRARAP